MSITIKKSISADIEAIIAAGDSHALATASDAVVRECARRYIAEQITQRNRGQVRRVERRSFDSSHVDAAMRSRMHQAASDYTASVVGWTADLLNRQFKRGDGSIVRWGDATVEDHMARAEALEEHAAGTIQTAALHRKAVEDIRSRGVLTLREAVS